MKIAIIGAGLFGHNINRALQGDCHTTTLIDPGMHGAGSPPTAALINPSWTNKFVKSAVELAWSFLHEHFEVKELWFQDRGKPERAIPMKWVDPAVQMSTKSTVSQRLMTFPARGITPGLKRRWAVHFEGIEQPEEYDMVVVSAGVWTQRFFEQDLRIKGKAGAAWLLHDFDCEPFVQTWAPYKQVVGFHRGDGFWISDGTAIYPENLTRERIEESRRRCFRALGLDTLEGSSPFMYNELYGIRPYVPDNPCLVREMEPSLWAAVGGKKNGTLLSAYAAATIRDALRRNP